MNDERASLRLTARLTARALVAVGLLAAASPADAFRMILQTQTGRQTSGFTTTCTSSSGFTHWNVRDIDWRHNTANQGAGKASALQAAMSSWTNVPAAFHELNYAGTTTNGWATDGTNTMLWAVGNGCVYPCLALTALVLQTGQVIVESDVTFNDDEPWTTTGANFDTEAVAAHELGHSLGIHHTNVTSSPTPTMNASYFGSAGRSLEADDKAALQCAEAIYPAIDCSQSSLWNCTPCCGSTNCSCTDTRECRSGTFGAWNSPGSGKRTGIRVCPRTHDVIFKVTRGGSTGTVQVDSATCANLHLDELTWSPSQPTFSALETVSFSVVDAGSPSTQRTAKVLTSRTQNGSNYDIYKVASCSQ